MTEAEYEAYMGRRSPMAQREPRAPRGNKYHAIKVEVDGMVFDSKAEAARWHELRLMAKAGLIRDLERQVRYSLDVPEPAGGDGHICDYRADFSYFDEERGCVVVEDVKGVVTDAYRLKSKLMLALRGVTVEEIRSKPRTTTGKRPAPKRKRAR